MRVYFQKFSTGGTSAAASLRVGTACFFPSLTNSSSGIRGAWITKHNPSIKIDPELVAVATLDILGKWRSGATGAFTTGVIGSTAGNRYQLAAGRTQFREMSLGDREGARITALTLAITTAVNAVDGDDYTLALT